MKSKFMFMLVLYACITTSMTAISKADIIAELKNTPYGSFFFNTHSEKKFILMMNFLSNPICYFKKIKKINNFFEYIEIYDRYSTEKKLTDRSTYDFFLEKHFENIDKQKVDILNYLLLISDGMYGEYSANKYTHLFSNFSAMIVNSLKKRDWKKIVNKLDSGNWQEFKSGLEKLGETEFERIFKCYVLASRDEQGNKILKK